ncbi:hypothetical protein CVT24_000573 [Panaeolus cyanescens]|uniref:Uncharacterized protein n=1 Tax=Panaeolus cyanescens TaxID=181874 RepID=A0A409YDA4_9AGAR|nr:hypothetical protein CVT24_000573 [Panaeolus cyanescens]
MEEKNETLPRFMMRNGPAMQIYKLMGISNDVEKCRDLRRTMRQVYLAHYNGNAHFYMQTEAMKNIQKDRQMKEMYPEIFKHKKKGALALQYLTHYARVFHQTQKIYREMKAAEEQPENEHEPDLDGEETDSSGEIVIDEIPGDACTEIEDCNVEADEQSGGLGQALVHVPNAAGQMIAAGALTGINTLQPKMADVQRAALQAFFQQNHPDLLPHFLALVDLKFIANVRAIQDYISSADIFKEDTLRRWINAAKKHGAKDEGLGFETFHFVLTVVGKYLETPCI